MRENAEDVRWMRAALKEARRGLGFTSPNPAVGAVLVSQGKMIGAGHHLRAGEAHAEVKCLRPYKGKAPKGATLYVTLEPCSTTGKTPPCTEAIFAAGVTAVVIGALDPNPAHGGRALDILRASGVRVRAGILEAECTALNEMWNKWIRTRIPFVVAKCGMTLDGRLTRPAGENSWITSPQSRRHSNALRSQFDAILIGAGTLRADNPHLTLRGAKQNARQPWRIVLSRSLQLPHDAHLFTDRHAERTRVVSGKLLADVLVQLGAEEITSVLIEGGGEVLGEALDEQLIDRAQIYLAPIFTGGPSVAFAGVGAGSTPEAARLRDVGYQRIGDDICITGAPFYSTSQPE